MKRLGRKKVDSYLGFYVPLGNKYWDKGRNMSLAYVDMTQKGTLVEVTSSNTFRLFRGFILTNSKMIYEDKELGSDVQSLRYHFRRPYRNEIALLKFD